MKKVTIFALALLLGSVAGRAQEDPCAFAGTVNEYFSADRAAGAAEAAETAAKETTEEETKRDMASRTNDDGLAGGRLDLLRRAFIAFDLGQVTDEEGALVFNFNPDLLDFDVLGQFSPRAVVHQATLFAPLDEKIGTLPEDQRQSTKDALSKELGDLDDVEFRLRWTPRFSTPVQEIEAAARTIFDKDYKAVFQPEAVGFVGDLAELTGSAKAAGLTIEGLTVKTVCEATGSEENPGPKEVFLKLADRWKTKTAPAFDLLISTLSDDFFFALADLIEGQPKLVGEAAFRQRQDAAGPNEGTASLRFEVGPRSYWGWKNWAKSNNKALDATSAQEYLKGFQGTLPLVSLTVDYNDTSHFEIPLPGGTETFSQDGGSKVSAALQGGIYLGTSRAHRLSLEAKYDWASSNRQDRFVSTFTWTEKPDAALGEAVKQFTGGGDIVVSLVYANKPEFRGEVDEEFGMRAGLKWSFGGTKN